MARFDHASSVLMTRATLKSDVNSADFDKVLPVGLDASGLAEPKSASNSGFVGVTILNRTVRQAGKRIDLMRQGEIVDCVGLTAGTKYYVQANGSLGTARTAIYVGYTVEADRLVVDFQGGADA